MKHVWMAEGLIYHETPTNLKIIHAWVSTGHYVTFCKGYENVNFRNEILACSVSLSITNYPNDNETVCSDSSDIVLFKYA